MSDLERVLTNYDEGKGPTKLPVSLTKYTSLTDKRKKELRESIVHFEEMNRKIQRIPQFKNSDDFLQCLANSICGDTLDELMKGHVPQRRSDKIQYFVVIENQRGSTIFRTPLYSNDTMLAFDPPKFQTLDGHSLGELGMYPLPDSDWKWGWQNWHVLMIKDVDEEGWIYSPIRFGSYTWKGKAGLGKLVRRRIWVRMAERFSEEKLVMVKQQGPDGTAVGDAIQDSEYTFLPTKLVVNPGKGEDPSSFYTSCRIDTLKLREAAAKAAVKAAVKGCGDKDVYQDAEENEDNSERAYSGDSSSEPDLATLSDLEQFYQQLSGLPLDRLQINRILGFLNDADPRTLRCIHNDFVQKWRGRPRSGDPDDSWSWLEKVVSTLNFHESKVELLTRLREEVALAPYSPEKNELLSHVSTDLYTCLESTLYAFEKAAAGE